MVSVRLVAFVLVGLAVVAALGLAALASSGGSTLDRFPHSAYRSGLEPLRPDQENAIRRGVFAAGRLWLLSDAGEVWALDRGKRSPERLELPEPAHGICAWDGQLYVAVGRREAARAWAVLKRGPDDWLPVASVATHDEGLASLHCGSGELELITSGRIISVRPSGLSEVKLSTPIPGRLISTVLATPNYFFVGLNVGEWGGGLHRIARQTGRITKIAKNDTGEMCGGPLNPQCDPVNGLAVSPGRPDCIIAAIGLHHMGARGRLVEVCGSEVRHLYMRPCPGADEKDPVRSDAVEPRCSEAYFGLSASGDKLTAVGTFGLTFVDSLGRATHTPFPKLENYGPFRAAFLDGIAVLETTVNQRHSLSGVTPLLVPLQ